MVKKSDNRLKKWQLTLDWAKFIRSVLPFIARWLKRFLFLTAPITAAYAVHVENKFEQQQKQIHQISVMKEDCTKIKKCIDKEINRQILEHNIKLKRWVERRLKENVAKTKRRYDREIDKKLAEHVTKYH